MFGLLLTHSLANFSSHLAQEVSHGQELQLKKIAAVLQPMVKSFVREKAVDAALQIELYLKANPQMTVEALQNDEAFRKIALQPVGKTGFTALLGSDDGIIYFHPSPRIQGTSIKSIARISPRLYIIMKKSLGGKHSHGAYPWFAADGTSQQKYNYIAPVGQPTADGIFFNLGAIVSVQDLYSPLESAENISQGGLATLISKIEQQSLDFRNKGVLFLSSGLLLLVLLASFAGRFLSGTITRLRLATREVKQGNFEAAVIAETSGELGELVADFNHMVKQLSETTVKKALLEESEKRLQLALQGAELGVLDWDIKTGHVFFNERWVEMLSDSSDKISPQITTWTDSIHPDERSQTEQKLDAHLQGKSHLFEAEHRLQTKSGTWIWVLNKGGVIEHDNDGTPLRAVITQLDITSRKEKEQTALQMAKQQEQLSKFESLKTMAGAIAHRFNNAMMAVQGNMELLMYTLPADSKEHKMVSSAVEAARGASQVGFMMLSYVGQQPRNLQNVHLEMLVRECVTLLKTLFQPSVSLQISPPEQTLHCSMDHNQIKEVVVNLLTNAIESIGNDSGAIEITFGTDYFTTLSFPVVFQNENLHDGMYTFCQIKDSGHGISAKHLSRIFEPFYTTRFVGRGLGLALTVGVMQSHHGAVMVESVPDQGTTVRLLFPVLSSTQQKTPSDDVFPQGDEARQLSGNILLADDEEMVLDVGRDMLELMGLTVHTAVSGQEAVDKICNQDIEFCAAVLDISMSHMDGIEAMKTIRESNHTLPILLSSGYSEDDFSFEEEGGKPDAFLGKPFQISDIRNCLEKLLV